MIEIIKQIQSGNKQAFTKLHHLFNPIVAGFFKKREVTEEELENLLQEFWIKVARGINSLHNPFAYKRWFFIIARNLFNDFIKHKKREEGHMQFISMTDAVMFMEDGDKLELEDILGCTFTCENANSTTKDTLSNIYNLAKTNDFIFSAILCGEGNTYREIQEVIKCKEGTVKSRICRGRIKLRELFPDAV